MVPGHVSWQDQVARRSSRMCSCLRRAVKVDDVFGRLPNDVVIYIMIMCNAITYVLYGRSNTRSKV